MKFMKHPDLDAVIQVPDESVPIYRQSNWTPLTDEEVVELEAKRRTQSQAAEAAMAGQPPPRKADPEPESAPEPSPSPAPRKPASKENS